MKRKLEIAIRVVSVCICLNVIISGILGINRSWWQYPKPEIAAWVYGFVILLPILLFIWVILVYIYTTKYE